MLVQELLKENPDLVGQPGPNGETPLQIAASAGSLEVAEFLVTHNADINSYGREGFRMNALFKAVLSNHKDVVAMLLEHGAQVDATDSISATPLTYAALKGELDIVELLVQHGANINTRDADGKTPLHSAVTEARDIPTVQFLLAHGAQIDAKDKFGKSAAYYAVGKQMKSLFAAPNVQAAADSAGKPSTNEPGPAKILPIGYSMNFVKSDQAFQPAIRKVAFDQISSNIESHLAAQLLPQGFELRPSPEAGAPQIVLDLKKAEVITNGVSGQSILLTVNIQVTLHPGQTGFSKDYTGAAAPNAFDSVNTLLFQAVSNIAETIASDRTFIAALKADDH